MNITFNSQKLQSAFEASKNTLENINKIKNNISNDIKTFESHLKSLHINENFIYKISGSNMTLEEIFLLWDDEKQRLIYKETRFLLEDYEDHDYRCSIADRHLFEPKKTIIERPLIEMPFDVRKMAFEHLSDFLLSLSKKYNVTRSENDCPF
ncbi:hypothetical protein E3983_05415 [Legionella israelensis]|uniref:Uncharacterized protein n=1 Tax=Legionella israelensis TaxID=454 RepID=A0AAX1EFG2_9GAMM|nr:hypothetical protein [Legionella israelensis]QBR83834.1 hypothetical protein E3983_05415 [Legionella israelensis]